MGKEYLFSQVDRYEFLISDTAMEIWKYAEPALSETRSSDLLRTRLQDAGFSILPAADLPTGFVAEFGHGKPVVGLLAEYDALPNLSQEVCASRRPRRETVNGHGCGHNLIAAACLGAALAVRTWMEHEHVSGTIRVYGCPAEEALAGKRRMVLAGLFDELDCALTFHPSQLNVVVRAGYLATLSMKFHFKGTPAHAAAAPELGRSALDAVELMNVGANYLREHINEKARLHYCITNGGEVPNIVPENAEVWYTLRAPHYQEIQEISKRLIKVAQGAALMTETSVSYTVLSGCCDVIANEVLSSILDKNMQAAAGPDFTEKEYAFAEALAANFPVSARRTVGAAAFAADQIPPDAVLSNRVYTVADRGKTKSASSDAGDVSYLVPFAQFNAATWPLGTAPHTWIACAASGSSIGMRAAVFAAKVLAGACQDIFLKPELAAQAREELQHTVGTFDRKILETS